MALLVKLEIFGYKCETKMQILLIYHVNDNIFNSQKSRISLIGFLRLPEVAKNHLFMDF